MWIGHRLEESTEIGMKQKQDRVNTETGSGRRGAAPTRREFLASAGITAGAFWLTGCGGGSGSAVAGGGGSTALTVGMVSGKAVLPSGAALMMSSLRAEAGLSSASISADGSFQVRTASGTAPALASLRHVASDRVVILGFVGRTSSNSAISSRGTALALLYFALGAYALPADHLAGLLDLLDQESAVTDLETVIAQRIAANPFALDDADAGIAAAVNTAYSAIWGAGRSSSVAGNVVPPAARATRADTFALLLVEPSGEQGGVEVLQGQAERTIVATNHKRKPCLVLNYRIAMENAAGARTDYPKAIRFGDPIDLPSTTGLNPFSNLANLRSGQTAFVPVSTAPITLTAIPDANKTFYDTIVLMASGDTAAPEPAYFTDARYADEVAGWRETLGQLNLAVMLELLLGAVTAVLGGAALSVSVSRIKAFEAAVAAIGDTSVLDLLAKARSGYLSPSVEGFLDIAARSNSLGSRLRSELLQDPA